MDAYSLPILATNFLKYATFGVTTEVVFTAIVDVVNNRRAARPENWRLKGESYIWMLPIYGSIAFLAPLVFPHFQEINLLLRVFIYALIIFGVEYVTGMALKLSLGRCPWHYESRWAIHNVIRLDYLPLWMGFSFVIEWLYYL